MTFDFLRKSRLLPIMRPPAEIPVLSPIFGAGLILVATFLLFAFLLGAIARIDAKDEALENAFDDCLLGLTRAGMGVDRGFGPLMDGAVRLIARMESFSAAKDLESAGRKIIGQWSRLRPYLSMLDQVGDASDSTPSFASSDPSRMIEEITTSIEAFIPLLREQRQSLRASFLLLLLCSGLGFAVVAVYVVWLWSRLRGSRIDAQWSKRSFQLSLEAEEAGRRRIACDLHDDTAQEIAAARMLCERAAASGDGDTSRARAAEASDLLKSAGSKLRSLVMDLRPPDLEQGGLVVALESLCERCRKYGGGDIQFFAGEGLPVIRDLSSIHVFRIAQESLANAAKHASGNRVEVLLTGGEEDGVEGLVLLVRDLPSRKAEGGRPAALPGETHGGKPDPSLSSGTGLAIMGERADFIGGRLDIERTGDSTTVRLYVPAGSPREGKK